MYTFSVSFRFETLNERQVRALADAHVHMYERRIHQAKSGFAGIRVDECERLLALWKSVQGKLAEGNWRLRLTAPEINEIRDALISGDYDDMLDVTKDRPS